MKMLVYKCNNEQEAELVVEVNDQIMTLKDTLKEQFGAKRIFIFGSNAYGEPDEDSDIDLCVILDLGNRRKIDIMREIGRVLHTLVSVSLDILVYSEEEFDERAMLKCTLEYKILNEGIRVYG